VIETARLLLRRWEARDRDPFAALNADPEVMGNPGTLPRGESEGMIESFETRWSADGYAFAAAERKADGAFIGMVGIQTLDLDLPFCPCVEIGWRLPRAHWGQGYATEAARAWLDYGFNVLTLREIVAFTDRDNHRSLAVMRGLGMVRDPRRDFDFPEFPEGDPRRPSLMHCLSRAQWRRTTSSRL
jgi:RimJ/RimL family protein N-acetyltransferase